MHAADTDSTHLAIALRPEQSLFLLPHPPPLWFQHHLLSCVADKMCVGGLFKSPRASELLLLFLWDSTSATQTVMIIMIIICISISLVNSKRRITFLQIAGITLNVEKTLLLLILGNNLMMWYSNCESKNQFILAPLFSKVYGGIYHLTNWTRDIYGHLTVHRKREMI